MTRIYKNIIKRLLDVFISFFALILLSPLLLLVIIVLFFTNNKAGIFFTQNRIGKNELPFKIYKFKSMTDKRDANGKLLPDAKRLTKIGQFIRLTSIDELPQLVNVLKGDMSIIGPRPLPPVYLPYYTKEEAIRHNVRPGITGWAQVNGRKSITWDQKLKLDRYYVQHLSFILDIKIILLTIRNVINRKDVGVSASGVLSLYDTRSVQRSEYTKIHGNR